MTDRELLLKEIHQLPEGLINEVLDFLLFIKDRHIQSKEIGQEQIEISLLSEPILAEEWLTPEEDEAWQHL